jgi:hypothetical protein
VEHDAKSRNPQVLDGMFDSTNTMIVDFQKRTGTAQKETAKAGNS